nr:hypothetical protein [Salmonella sp.]
MDGHQSAGEEAITNAAGVGAGGPLWMAARVRDITKEITGKQNFKEWVDNPPDHEAKSPAITSIWRQEMKKIQFQQHLTTRLKQSQTSS